MALNPKQAVKEWLSEQWEKRVKEPIERKTEELENDVNKQIETYSQKAKEQIITLCKIIARFYNKITLLNYLN